MIKMNIKLIMNIELVNSDRTKKKKEKNVHICQQNDPTDVWRRGSPVKQHEKHVQNFPQYVMQSTRKLFQASTKET